MQMTQDVGSRLQTVYFDNDQEITLEALRGLSLSNIEEALLLSTLSFKTVGSLLCRLNVDKDWAINVMINVANRRGCK